MSRWNIEQVILYSHHGKKQELNFAVKSVNIITGDSHTGKSAIPEIIDYAMGASECRIPGFARERLSWVGLVWKKEETTFVVLRKIPKPSQKSTGNFYYDFGKFVDVPQNADAIRTNARLEGMLRQYERLFGIGDAKTEVFGSEQRETKKVTVRNVIPYLIHDDQVILNKEYFLRGTNDYKRRQNTIDSLPYFLGVVDEDTLGKELVLKNLRHQLTRLEKQAARQKQIVGDGESLARTLVLEAAQLGMCPMPHDTVSNAQINRLLMGVLYQRHQLKVEENSLSELYETQTTMQNRVVELKTKVRLSKKTLAAATQFNDTVQKQKSRLDVIKVFKNPKDPNMCPLCQQHTENKSKPIESIRRVVHKVQADLANVNVERPKIDGYVRELNMELYQCEQKLKQIGEEIERTVKQREDMENITLIDQRNRVQGRISLYVETLNDSLDEEEDKVDSKKRMMELLETIETLEHEVNPDSKAEALENVERRIASIASQILGELPLENRYRDNPVFLRFRDLKMGFSLPTHVESGFGIGSDENHLSLHVAILLALHRHFAETERPVPGVLLFDQLSRPYFPPEVQPNEVIIKDNDERASLLRYFDLLFKEVDREETLQIIVLEHAYFANHPRYVESVKYRWMQDINGLVPFDWPVYL